MSYTAENLKKRIKQRSIQMTGKPDQIVQELDLSADKEALTVEETSIIQEFLKQDAAGVNVKSVNLSSRKWLSGAKGTSLTF